MGNWKKEAGRFTPELPVLLHHGTRRTKQADAFRKEAQERAIVITGYPLLHRDFDVLKRIRWGAVILDEAQNIKNPSTKQAQAARALKADHRIALTGTPVENHVGELWSAGEFQKLMVLEYLFVVGGRNKDAAARFGIADEKAVAGIKFRAVERLRGMARQRDPNHSLFLGLWEPGSR